MPKRQPLLFGGSSKAWDKQFVWPREHGRKRTFMSGIKDILGGKGPDIFITPKGDSTPIKMDHWANWDGYHNPDAQATERRFAYKGAWNADRGTKRYDPFIRKYVQWDTDNNWNGMNATLPTLTREEHEWMTRHPGRRYPNHKEEWTTAGPNRKRKEYRPFWQQARRVGDNLQHGMAEESDHLASDAVLLDFYDRTGLTHGARRHVLHAARKGRPDCFMGGRGTRRYLTPQSAGYDGRRDTRGMYPPMDEAWDLSDEEMEDIMDGRLSYWGELERQPAYWNRGVGPGKRHMEQYYR